MKQINFGRFNNKDVISILDTETCQYKIIAEIIIPWQEAKEEITECIKNYISVYGGK